MTRLRVGVVFGGRSGEHEISLASAASVIAALERGGHAVVPIGITRDGRCGGGGDPLRALATEARIGLPASDPTGAARLVIPALIPPAITSRVREQAIAAFRAIDCAGMARVDFFLEGDRVLVNEINPLPGFTATSGYARMWEASGLDYVTLIDRLIHLPLERHQEKSS